MPGRYRSGGLSKGNLHDTNVKAKLTHDEHNPIELPSGIYKVKIVREWDHIGGVSRNVVD